MPRVEAEAEPRTLTECQYSYPAETLSDLQRVRSVFPDLHLYVDFYCFPNKEKRKLVYLRGTLPVHYDGNGYNIPVCIWLHETHPVSRPRCYVCPSASMTINPSCSCVDASGNIDLHGLKSWTHGESNLLLLVSEMRLTFQKNTPLYSRGAVQAPPRVQVLQSGESLQDLISSSSSSSSHLSGQRASQWKQSKEVRSYMEELLGIDFSAPSSSSISSSSTYVVPPPDPLSRMMGALKLDRDQKGASPRRAVQSEAARGSVVRISGSSPAPGPRQDPCTGRPQSQPAADVEYIKMLAQLPPDRAAMFVSLMSMEDWNFLPSDVMEAVQLNRDFPSALKFLTHNCPICQEQVSFSKTCFKRFFSSAIKEKSIDQLVCPQCGKPEIRCQGGLEDSMEYFNLLDTQIRHFLPPQIHELFQRKLRDRALQEMPTFRWCAHCSFGMLHEADRLRMDCPSCKKSTCCQCRSPWSPQHQGLSCDQFRVWQQQNQPEHYKTTLQSYNSIECPNCQFVFGLSRGGCLHFTCSLCQHQFCGGCRQPFRPGSACSFSADCGTRGLHAHHPRDCLYHLRDWSLPRLHLLLQYYKASPTWLEPANGDSGDSSRTGKCCVLELKDDGGRCEQPCGRPAPPECRGYCQAHYKEHLVELINRCHGDPAVLFNSAEMRVELQRWNLAVPPRRPDEPELLYAHRLRLILTKSVPLSKQRRPPLKLHDA